MDTTLNSLLALMRLTLTNPREGARRVLATELEPGIVWQAFALVAVVSVLLVELSTAIVPMPADVPLVALYRNPLVAGLVQALALFVTAFAMHRVGAAFGGTGRFDEALKLVVWIEVMLIALQLVQILALLLLPLLVPLVFVMTIAWSIWMLTSAVMELHGFQNALKVFFGIIGSSIAIAFALLIAIALLNAFGIITVTGPPDV